MSRSATVVDTSAWIEWLMATSVGQEIEAVFPEREQCIVPTIVQLELSKWLVREIGEDKADQVIAYTQKCQVAVLDSNTALLAADMHRQYKLATADAIVYATAQAQQARLLTCDVHFQSLAAVDYFSKKAP